VCGHKRGLIRGHHVIYQQNLKRICKDAGEDYAAWRWDQRNMLPMCDICHERHHRAARRVTQDILRRRAPKVMEFAFDLDAKFDDGRKPATAFLLRFYPLPT
jgi:hypothetical protein